MTVPHADSRIQRTNCAMFQGEDILLPLVDAARNLEKWLKARQKGKVYVVRTDRKIFQTNSACKDLCI